MKQNTPDLMKFKRLQRALGLSRRGLAGLLELLWLETAKNCPEGDIGRFTDEEIAILCDWEGDAGALVSALVDTGWLDECLAYRLLVHDWPEHAPNYVKGNIKRHGREFAMRCSPEDAPLGGSLGGSPEETPSRAHAQPSQAKPTVPSQTKSNQAGNQDASTAVDGPALESFDEFWRLVPNRIGKQAARKAWPKAVDRKAADLGTDPAWAAIQIIAAMGAFSVSPKAAGRYVPNPATWLNEGRYDDDPATWQDDGEPSTRSSRNMATAKKLLEEDADGSQTGDNGSVGDALRKLGTEPNPATGRDAHDRLAGPRCSEDC